MHEEPTGPRGATTTRPVTSRARAKADRRRALLEAAAELFADRGFHGVSLEDLGTAAGVSGPAVYRHFANKQAVLAELLIGVSARLLRTGREVVATGTAPRQTLAALIEAHLDFALAEPDTIRVQDRELFSLPPAERHRVRRLQRDYVGLWSDVLAECVPGLAADERRIRVQATFGALNSTPHTARVGGSPVAAGTVRPVLRRLAERALSG